jgi:hypothetical protein
MFDLTQGPARTLIDLQQVASLIDSQVLVIDGRRRRPRYFDGRFLAARDLTREQNYFLTRQADYGRAAGYGVVQGLGVRLAPRVTGRPDADVEIAAGHGITLSGETVLLPAPLRVVLADALAAEQLDAAFGLRRIPSEPLRSRTGLFVLALRPVEFSANPIAAYPTSIAGDRRVEDGDIIEATAVTLIPWPDQVGPGELELARGRIAREIFLGGRPRGLPENALPLAVVALARGVLQWLDPYLVRREIGSDREDIVGLGFAPRALREAHLHQYIAHLQRVVTLVDGQPFAAASWFPLLPPAGPLPPNAIDTAEFTHRYFPPEVDVTLSIVPDDEITALVEESLLLPPIDLTESGDALESTSVLMLAPVPRASLRTLAASLRAPARALKAAAPNLVAKRRPLELLRGIRTPWIPQPPLDTSDVENQAWRNVIQQAGQLWYMRRRNLAYSKDFAGEARELGGNEREVERALDSRVRELGLHTVLEKLDASTEARAEVVRLLASPKFERSATLLAAAVNELKSKDALDRIDVLAVRERYAQPGFGEGLARLEAAAPGLAQSKAALKLAASGAMPEIDALARIASDRDLGRLARELETSARSRSAEKLGELARKRFKELGA